MYNSGKVIIGIIIFILLFTSPIWTNLFSSGTASTPNLEFPKNSKECVMDKDYMNHYHMDLLNEWRDKVVRKNIRYLTKDGKPFYINGKPAEMSLTKTCLNCHNDKSKFCDQCHNYMDVKPYCWDCHIDKYDASDNELNFKNNNKIENVGNHKEVE